MITLSSDGQNLQCKPQCKPQYTYLTFSTRHHYKTLETSSDMAVLNLIYLKHTMHQHAFCFCARQSMGDRVYSSASSTQTGNGNKVCARMYAQLLKCIFVAMHAK